MGSPASLCSGFWHSVWGRKKKTPLLLNPWAFVATVSQPPSHRGEAASCSLRLPHPALFPSTPSISWLSALPRLAPNYVQVVFVPRHAVRTFCRRFCTLESEDTLDTISPTSSPSHLAPLPPRPSPSPGLQLSVSPFPTTTSKFCSSRALPPSAAVRPLLASASSEKARTRYFPNPLHSLWPPASTETRTLAPLCLVVHTPPQDRGQS